MNELRETYAAVTVGDVSFIVFRCGTIRTCSNKYQGLKYHTFMIITACERDTALRQINFYEHFARTARFISSCKGRNIVIVSSFFVGKHFYFPFGTYISNNVFNTSCLLL